MQVDDSLRRKDPPILNQLRLALAFADWTKDGALLVVDPVLVVLSK